MILETVEKDGGKLRENWPIFGKVKAASFWGFFAFWKMRRRKNFIFILFHVSKKRILFFCAFLTAHFNFLRDKIGMGNWPN